ncbi:MAG: exodeoxyribonuclease VII small subunit [Candidatus Margulisiibacteriota bacterium]
MTKQPKQNIKSNLAALEDLLGNLEDPDLDLDQAVSHYAKAIQLAGETQKALEQAQNTITVLKQDGDKILTQLAALDA